MFNVSPVYLANYEATENIVINQGGTDCFDGNTYVVTDNGNKKISELSVDDMVLSYNLETKQNEYNKVLNVFKFNNMKPTIKVKLKNGTEIIVTEDHRFFYEGGWISLRNILSLKDGTMDKNT